MIKFIAKSIFLYILLALMFCIIFFLTTVILTKTGEDFSITSGATYAVFILSIAYVWLFTKFLSVIAHSLSFMYWLFCLGLATVSYFLRLSNPITVTTLFLHYSVLMFLIPELHGLKTIYLNTETTINSYGKITEQRIWTSEKYVPGCIRKLFLMIFLSVLFYCLELWLGIIPIKIIFWLQVAYTGILTVINIISFSTAQ